MVDFKLSCTGNTYGRWGLEDTIESISRLGYDGIQVLAERPHLYPPDFDKNLRMKVKNLLEKNNLHVSALDACHFLSRQYLMMDARTYRWPSEPEPNFGARSLELRQARIEYTNQTIDLAVDLGTDKVVTFAGPVVCDPDEGWNYVVEGLSECAEYAKQRKVYLLVETASRGFCATPEETMQVINAINSPWLGVNLDVGHMCFLGIDPSEAIRKVSKRMMHVHIEDIKGRNHFHLIPGTGDIDFKAVIQTLVEVGYSGFLAVEIYTQAHNPEYASREAIKYMKTLFKRL